MDKGSPVTTETAGQSPEALARSDGSVAGEGASITMRSAPIAVRKPVAEASTGDTTRGSASTAARDIPSPGDAPVAPLDYLIGALGPGEAPEGAYRAAAAALDSLVSGASGTERQKDILSRLGTGPKLRLGAGRLDAEGQASFLVRLVGDGRSSSGEIQLSLVGGTWTVDSLVLDDPVVVAGPDGGAFDPLTYHRFL